MGESVHNRKLYYTLHGLSRIFFIYRVNFSWDSRASAYPFPFSLPCSFAYRAFQSAILFQEAEGLNHLIDPAFRRHKDTWLQPAQHKTSSRASWAGAPNRTTVKIRLAPFPKTLITHGIPAAAVAGSSISHYILYYHVPARMGGSPKELWLGNAISSPHKERAYTRWRWCCFWETSRDVAE